MSSRYEGFITLTPEFRGPFELRTSVYVNGTSTLVSEARVTSPMEIAEITVTDLPTDNVRTEIGSQVNTIVKHFEVQAGILQSGLLVFNCNAQSVTNPIVFSYATNGGYLELREETKEGVYRYSNPSRQAEIDTNEGRFRFILDSGKEYEARFGKGREDPSSPWSHFLLEQDFVESIKLKDLSALYASLRFKLNKAECLDEGNFDPNKHTAQFIWYLTIREGRGNKKEELGGNFIWFGIPIYDYRYPSIAKHIQYDGDFAGSTRTLIYNLPTKDYLLDAPLKQGKEYEVCLDILPSIKRAVRYAMKAGIFKSSRGLVVNYMNIGWELPGSFLVDSEISSIRLKGVIGD